MQAIILAAGMGKRLKQLTPVSYTHLDVYKRQHPFCSFWKEMVLEIQYCRQKS